MAASGINFPSGHRFDFLHYWLFKHGFTLFRGGSEIIKVLSWQDLWSWFSFWTRNTKYHFHQRGKLLVKSELLKKTCFTCLLKCNVTHAFWGLLVLCHKVQIVLGSCLILEIHPQNKLILPEHEEDCVRETHPYCRKVDTFYSYTNVFNKL